MKQDYVANMQKFFNDKYSKYLPKKLNVDGLITDDFANNLAAGFINVHKEVNSAIDGLSSAVDAFAKNLLASDYYQDPSVSFASAVISLHQNKEADYMSTKFSDALKDQLASSAYDENFDLQDIDDLAAFLHSIFNIKNMYAKSAVADAGLIDIAQTINERFDSSYPIRHAYKRRFGSLPLSGFLSEADALPSILALYQWTHDLKVTGTISSIASWPDYDNSSDYMFVGFALYVRGFANKPVPSADNLAKYGRLFANASGIAFNHFGEDFMTHLFDAKFKPAVRNARKVLDYAASALNATFQTDVFKYDGRDNALMETNGNFVAIHDIDLYLSFAFDENQSTLSEEFKPTDYANIALKASNTFDFSKDGIKWNKSASATFGNDNFKLTESVGPAGNSVFGFNLTGGNGSFSLQYKPQSDDVYVTYEVTIDEVNSKKLSVPVTIGLSFAIRISDISVALSEIKASDTQSMPQYNLRPNIDVWQSLQQRLNDLKARVDNFDPRNIALLASGTTLAISAVLMFTGHPLSAMSILALSNIAFNNDTHDYPSMMSNNNLSTNIRALIVNVYQLR